MPKIPQSKRDNLNKRGFIFTDDVAELLGVTDRTVRSYCQEHKITSYKLGGSVIYKRTEIERMINEQIS